MCLGDLSEAKTSELLSSASHRDEGPRLRCPGNVLLGAGVPSGTPGPCVRHLWAAFCSLPCWTGRSGPRGHLTGGGPHPVACSPRQVAPLLGSSWRSRPGSGGPGRVGRAVVLGVGGGARRPRGRRDGWQVARPGQLCPEEHGIGTRKRPCPQKTRPSEQRPPGESDLPSLRGSVTEPSHLAAGSRRPRTCHHHGPGALGRDTQTGARSWKLTSHPGAERPRVQPWDRADLGGASPGQRCGAGQGSRPGSDAGACAAGLLGPSGPEADTAAGGRQEPAASRRGHALPSRGLWVAGLLFYPSAGTHAAPYLGWRVS